MGLLDKLKNVFFEEEEIEVEEKPKKVKKEKPLVKKIETPKRESKEIKKEIIEEEPIEKLEDFIEDDVKEDLIEENFKKNSDDNFKFPVILDDEEEVLEEETIIDKKFEYKEPKRENNIYGVSDTDRVTVNYESDYHKEPYSNSYTRDLNSASYSLRDRKEVKAFKPSPVISPVYGVLDKNYKSDEIREKNKPERKDPPVFSFSSTKLDLDEVRAKAFGIPEGVTEATVSEIEDDIEETNDIEITDVDNDTIDMTDTQMKPIVDSVTVGDAEEYFEDLGLEYNVDYKDSKKKTRSKRKTRSEKEEVSKEDGEQVITDEPKKKRSKEKDEDDINIDIEDNLFDLIDSMYDEGE